MSESKVIRRTRKVARARDKDGNPTGNLAGPFKASDEQIASARERNWPRKPEPVPESTWVSEEEDKDKVIQKYKDKIHNPMSAIRAFCCGCHGGYIAEITRCTATDCALHPFRQGQNPFHKRSVKSKDKSE